ncbi:MAG TPA: hypothetical protein VF815_16675 [Myxococcaceae bacterium]|jgi:hypothetical protein
MPIDKPPRIFTLSQATGKWGWVSDEHQSSFRANAFNYSFTCDNGDRYFSNVYVYRLALVGVGSSIAYYLNALGAPYVDPPRGSLRPRVPQHRVLREAVLFGTTDAWDITERGDGFINHERHQISHWGPKAPVFSPDYMERAEFAAENRAVFNRARGVTWIKHHVSAIKAFGDVYKVFATNGYFYYASKVIVGMGAGPHQKPRTMVIEPEAQQQVQDLDQFMRANPRSDLKPLAGKHIIVNGANAGIDAVERAACLGARVTWFIGSTNPVILPGHRLQHAGELAKRAISVDYNVEILARPADTIRVVYTLKKQTTTTTIDADVYVYALGQEPMAAGAVGDVLITQGNIPWQELEPIYDINQVFGEPYETVVGLQRKKTNHDRGLQIIGAAAVSLASVTEGTRPRIPHNFTEQFSRELKPRRTISETRADEKQRELISQAEAHLKNKTVVASLNAAVRQDIGSVVLTSQLVGVKGTVAALTGFAPEYLSGDMNPTVDNRTMLRIYLAHFLPNLREVDAQNLINTVLSGRKSKAIGYSPEEVLALKVEAVRLYWARLESLLSAEEKKRLSRLPLASDGLRKSALLLREGGGEITQVRKRKGKQQVTISLTPSRYRL